MKKNVFLTLIAVSLVFVSYAGGLETEKVESIKSITISQKVLPYSISGVATMEKVYSKDNYTLWRCPSEQVTNFPGKSITGVEYNYFVYKNNKFHLTVNNNNKGDVYKFFSE